MRVEQNVLAVLSRMEPDGDVLRIGDGQLDRDLYVKVNKVLEAIGGKWNRKAKGHVFSENPAARLDMVILTGSVELPKDEFEFFPTPAELVEDMIGRAGIRSGMTALEPSAGRGAIVKALLDNDLEVDAYEIMPANIETLNKLVREHPNRGQSAVFGADFLEIAPARDYDRVFMNPPFSRQRDIDHVLHAWKFLKPRGRLVAIMSAGVAFRENRKSAAFRAFVVAHGGYLEKNADGAFKESGTSVNTITVVIEGASS